MKKVLLVCTAIFLCTIYLQAQEKSQPSWYLTATSGRELPRFPLYSKIKIFDFGVGYEHPLAKKLSLMTELNLSVIFGKTNWEQSTTREIGGVERAGTLIRKSKGFSLNAKIPIYLKYKLDERFSFTGGVYANLPVFSSSSYSGEFYYDDEKEIYYDGEYSGRQLLGANYGLIAGIQYKINDRLDLRLEFNQDLFDHNFSNSQISSGWRRSSFLFGANYRLSKK